jgi:hypothetical protein
MENKLLYPYKLVGAHDLVTYSFLVLRKSITKEIVSKYNELIERYTMLSNELAELSVKSYWDLQPPFMVISDINYYEYNYPALKFDYELSGKKIDFDSVFNPQVNEIHYVYENNPLYSINKARRLFAELLGVSNNGSLAIKYEQLFTEFIELANSAGHNEVKTKNERISLALSVRELLFLSQNYIYSIYSVFKDQSIDQNDENIRLHSESFLNLIDEDFEVLDYSMLYNAGYICVMLRGEVYIIMAGSGQPYENQKIDKHAVKEWYNNTIGNAMGSNYYYEAAFLYVRKIMEMYPEQNIVLTGHSKGGGAAIYAGQGFAKNIQAITFDATFASRSTKSKNQFEIANGYEFNENSFSLNFVEVVTSNAARINIYSKSSYKMHILNWLNPTYCDYLEQK